MRAPDLMRAAGLAALVGGAVAGCGGTAGTAATGTATAAPGTASPAPGTATAAPGTASPTPGTATAAPGSSARAPAALAPASPAGAPECRGSQLKVRLIYGGPAAGTVGAVLSFTNEGRVPCRLAGWPAVVAVGPAGRTRAERTLAVFAGPVLTRPPAETVRHGGRVVAMIAAGDQPGPGMTACPPPYQRLLVTPPGGGHATVVPALIPASGGYLPACSTIQVSPVVPASDLPFLRLHHV